MIAPKNPAVPLTWESREVVQPPTLTAKQRDIENVGEGIVFTALGAEMQKIRAQAEMLAQANVPVLILGERGTEKEAVARLLHKLFFGTTDGFHRVNCSSPRVSDGQLFPSKSDSGSSSETEPGAGNGEGTVFLDDLAALPAALQARLVEELSQLPKPVANGSRGSRGIRLLVASEPAVQRLVETGKLREDLYEQVRSFTIRVLPLRNRLDEIEPLLQYTMERLASNCRVAPRPISHQVLEACREYAWPGNFRELEDFVRQYLLFGEQGAGAGPASAEKHALLNEGPVKSLSGPDRGSQVAEQGPERNSFLRSIRQDTERKAIAAALETTHWNRKAAAHLLKVSYRSLLYKIVLYKMSPPEGSKHPQPVIGPGGMGGENA